ncbi:MAG TPA: adenosylcobinamide-GDP ribazoletransferase [Polyangia bacterium]|nr:adenosylcobinamide-GDP ribazoletransferase [Polyangia bacterium]
MRGVVAALAFFTRIPTGGRALETDLPAALPWLPAIGLIVGGVGVGVDALVGTLAGDQRRLGALLVVAAWALLAGGLHLEGLADVCDALGASRRGEEAYRIMKDPHVGTYGMIGVVLVLLAQVEAISALAPARRVSTLLCAPILARVVPTAALKLFAAPPYLFKGLAHHARQADVRAVAVAATAALVFTLALGPLVPGLCALAIGFAALYSITRPLGGLTGDVCGAALELTSTAYMVVAALT